MKKYIITIIILFLVILISLCGSIFYTKLKENEGNSVDSLKEKAVSEIDFLNVEIIDIMNGLNNISYTNYKIINQEVNISSDESSNNISGENTIDESLIEYETTLNDDNSEINWEEISEIAETMYSSWTTVLIDLTTLDVNKENLLQFNDLLDDLITSMNEQNKETSLESLAELYNLLTIYLNDFSDDEQLKILYNTKSNILYAYSVIDSENWDEANLYIENAKNEFSKIMNNQINNINNIDEVNKSYILINEISDDISKNNKQTFYLNYIELMQEIENII